MGLVFPKVKPRPLPNLPPGATKRVNSLVFTSYRRTAPASAPPVIGTNRYPLGPNRMYCANARAWPTWSRSISSAQAPAAASKMRIRSMSLASWSLRLAERHGSSDTPEDWDGRRRRRQLQGRQAPVDHQAAVIGPTGVEVVADDVLEEHSVRAAPRAPVGRPGRPGEAKQGAAGAGGARGPLREPPRVPLRCPGGWQGARSHDRLSGHHALRRAGYCFDPARTSDDLPHPDGPATSKTPASTRSTGERSSAVS